MTRMTLRSTLVAAFAGLATAAAAAQVTEQPPIGEPVPFELAATRSIELPNGLEATFIQFGLAPMTRISIQVRAGNIDDGADTWIADLTGSMMEEGADGRSKAELAEAIASMGGEVGVGVGLHTTTVGTNVLSEHGPEALALLTRDYRKGYEVPEKV